LKALWLKYQALSKPGTAGIGCGFWLFRLNYVANLWMCWTWKF